MFDPSPRMVKEANDALLRLIVHHPDAIRLKPLMLEIAEDFGFAIDHKEPFEKTYDRLYLAAKVLYRERNK